MATFEIGPYKLDVDVEATVAAYLNVDSGGANTCTCTDCKNYAAQRGAVVPSDAQAFLEQFGIDSEKEVEVWTFEPRPHVHVYNGWFYAVGRLLSGPPEEQVELLRFGGRRLPSNWTSVLNVDEYARGSAFEIWPSTSPGPPEPAFPRSKSLMFCFQVALPWTIEDPETMPPGGWDVR